MECVAGGLKQSLEVLEAHFAGCLAALEGAINFLSGLCKAPQNARFSFCNAASTCFIKYDFNKTHDSVPAAVSETSPWYPGHSHATLGRHVTHAGKACGPRWGAVSLSGLGEKHGWLGSTWCPHLPAGTQSFPKVPLVVSSKRK